MHLLAGEPEFDGWHRHDPAHLSALLAGAERPLVLVDGRSGGGKTTFAAALADAIGADVVATDDVAWYESMFGWDDLLIEHVLTPWQAGLDIDYRPPAWDERERKGSITASAGRPLVIEGVGAGRASLRPFADLVVWVQSDHAEAERRGIPRDMVLHDRTREVAERGWRQWQDAEVPFQAQSRPWEHADLIVLGTAAHAGLDPQQIWATGLACVRERGKGGETRDGRSTMEVMTHVLDEREWTREERDELPDDGNRYELLDGMLLVTPAPTPPHQRIAGGLYRALYSNCPPELEVFFAPFDVTLDPRTVLEPDLLVVRRTDIDARGISAAPVLAVEVLSPSTKRVDRHLKLPKFAASGCPSFWLVDPDEPALTAFELDGEHYVEVAHVVGHESWAATRPFPLTIVPTDLLT